MLAENGETGGLEFLEDLRGGGRELLAAGGKMLGKLEDEATVAYLSKRQEHVNKYKESLMREYEEETRRKRNI
jgi:hypothetical protein